MANPFLKILIPLGIILLDRVDGHGRLLDPPQRSTMWRYGFGTPPNYNDNELNCGGFTNQYDVQGGRCGVCGDPYQGPRDNEAGGRYATGTIVRKYDIGQVVPVTVELTANHLGWFEFRICQNNDVTQRVSQHCLDQHLLEIVGHGTRYMVTDKRDSKFRLQLRLPAGLHCTQCVMQWKYYAGNNEGYTEGIGQCKGCGPQEMFLNCADVSVGAKHGAFHGVSFLNSAFVFPELAPRATVPPTYPPAPTFMPDLSFNSPFKDIMMAELINEVDADLKDKMEFPDIDFNDVHEENEITSFPSEMLDDFIEADVTMEFWDDVEEFLERSSDAVKAAVVSSAVDLFPTSAEGITKFHDLIKLVLWFQGIRPPSSVTHQTTLPGVVDDRINIFKVIDKVKSSDNLEDFFSNDADGSRSRDDNEKGERSDSLSVEDNRLDSKADSKSDVSTERDSNKAGSGSAGSQEKTSGESDSSERKNSNGSDSDSSDNTKNGSKSNDSDDDESNSKETRSYSTDESAERGYDVMREVVGRADTLFSDRLLDTMLGDGETDSETDPETESGSISGSSADDSKAYERTFSIEVESQDESIQTVGADSDSSSRSVENSRSTLENSRSEDDDDVSRDTDSVSSSKKSDSSVAPAHSLSEQVEEVVEEVAEKAEEVVEGVEEVAENVVEGVEEVVDDGVMDAAEVLDGIDLDLKDGAKIVVLQQALAGASPAPNGPHSMSNSIVTKKSQAVAKGKKSEELAEEMRQQLTRVFLENPLTSDGVCRDAAVKPTCHSMDIWRKYPVVDTWCAELCPNGFCPNYICDCQCPAACRALPELQFTSTTLDEWCRTNCANGNCPKYICTCS